jgi:hypothetical protein
MTKKKTMKNIKTPNKFDWGGDFKKAFQDTFSGENMGKALPGAIGAVGGIAEGLISNGFSTTGGQVLSGIGDAAMMFNPIVGGAIKLASGLVNRGFGTKWDNEGIAKAEGQIEGLNNFQSGASDFDALAKDFNSIGSMNKTIKASDLGKDGWFVNRTTNKANELNTELGNAYNYAIRNANNVADNIAGSTLANLERNYAAFGGPLFAYGGQTHGSDFTNGLMFINNGGTHESNPYEGVPISMDQEGNPNLVEEGEVIWNDYVFSNRLKVPKSIKKKYKLGKREMTFANAIDKLSKESEERPNDPISMRGLENILMHMAIEQENLKSNKQTKEKGNKFATGGPFGDYTSPFDEGFDYNGLWKSKVNALTLEELNRYLKAHGQKELSETEFEKFKEESTDNTKARTYEGSYHDKAWKALNWLHDNPYVEPVTANRYFIRNADGTVTQMTENLPFEGLNEYGRTWAELNPNYTLAGKQVRPQETIEGVPTTYTDYYYDPKEESSKENTTATTPPENLPTWMRYAPAIGYGALALTDALGITNKPDYTNAEAVINAANNVSNSTIKFNPIGDYLTYNPFDTEYHANQWRSVAGATRRNIMNTSGGNRAAAMAGVLAADNNTMNQMGDLYRKAAEYNLEQRHKVADFNRTTNITNSEGMFRADAANQSMKQVGFEGLMRGYAMKEQANLMSDQAKSANISGLLTSLGNIGYDNANRNMMNWGMASGTWAPSQWKYDPLTGKPVNQNG